MDEGVLRIIKILVNSFWPLLRAGLLYTVPLTLISFGVGLILAFITAIARLSSNKIFQNIAKFYVWVIRGTPLLVQLFVIFYGLPNIGIIIPAFTSAIIGFSISQGAYNSETIRAAIQSISKGQWEATMSIGMTRFQALRYIIIPQATRVAVPPLFNSFIGLIKDTSLAAVLTVQEMFQVSQQYVAVTYEPLWLYIEVGVIYLLFSTVLNYFQNKIEDYFGKHIQGSPIKASAKGKLLGN